MKYFSYKIMINSFLLNYLFLWRCKSPWGTEAFIHLKSEKLNPLISLSLIFRFNHLYLINTSTSLPDYHKNRNCVFTFTPYEPPSSWKSVLKKRMQCVCSKLTTQLCFWQLTDYCVNHVLNLWNEGNIAINTEVL